MPVPLSTEPRKLTFTLSDDDHRALFDLARRSRTSVSSLGRLAISQLLLMDRNGAMPLVKPSTIDNAQTVTCLGREV